MAENRVDMIANSLEEAVFMGEFADGHRLDEVSLAERFGVSRTPIRAALQKLALSGMAEQLPRRGVFVRKPGPVELIEMFETMAEMEASCGRLAASRITDEHLGKLVEANQRCKASIDANDPDRYYLENEVFHQLIYAASANAFLQNETLKLQNRLKAYRRVQLRFRGRMRQSLSEHDQIVEALDAGSADDVAGLLRNHVAVQGEKFQQLMATLKN